jgi:hypothetical protein
LKGERREKRGDSVGEGESKLEMEETANRRKEEGAKNRTHADD